MGNSGVEQSLAGKGKSAPLAGQDEEERSALEEKLYCTRLELHKTRAVSADADETICRLAAAARRMAQERDEAWNQRNALLAELHARRNAQMMMALAAGPPRPFAGYNGRPAFFAPAAAAAAPFGRMPTPMQQMYARAAGASYCFASSSAAAAAGNGLFFHSLASSSQDQFDPDMFLVDPAESPADSVSATTGSAAPDLQVAKSSGSELDLVAEQMLRTRKKGKVAEAVRDDDEGPASVEVVADAGAAEAGGSLDEKCGGGGGCSLADVVNSAGKKRDDAS
ncbi:hypothetical protein CFC21_051813 [Triticum aestivum]|uniref:Uncharacterized protein n=2 Tax=Triticum aestivum TaxID=4565 RepID=A0A9R1K5Y1_WHEAT|nr:hypothetical protein CFC21_051813 [Triticum aestivum]